MASAWPVSISAFGSMSPFTATSIAARGLRSSSIAVSFLIALPSAMSVFEMTMRSARIACLRASGAFSRFFRPFTASTTVSTTSMANSPPSARSVEKVCRIGLMSARPLVSISTRPKCGILPRSRSATSRRSVFCKSVRVLQHRQPLPSSVTSSLLSRSSASSMPSEPNSLTISAVPLPSGVSRNRRTSVVFPAPRNPVTIVTGSRDPRSRFCRRPNLPAACEGNRSRMVSVMAFIATTLAQTVPGA